MAAFEPTQPITTVSKDLELVDIVTVSVCLVVLLSYNLVTFSLVVFEAQSVTLTANITAATQWLGRWVGG